jgi:hypothetical protein
MDFKNILQSLTQISEATKETEKGKVHKADAGGYGRKFDTDIEGNEKKDKKPEAKKGRGRPKKDAGEDGEVKKYDTKSLHDVFGGGKKPKKEVGKTSKKHSLKEYFEEISQTVLSENEMPVQPRQPVVPMNKPKPVQKKTFGPVRTTEQDQVTIAPAQQNTQVIKQGDNVLGTVTNPQLAQQIKQSIGRGEMTLAGDDLGLSEVAPPGEKAERMVKHIKKGYAKDGKLTPKEKSIAYATAWKAHNKGKVEESINLYEQPSTMEHLINTHKNEVKRFMSGEPLDTDLYDALFDYYLNSGEMPYGVAKARAGDPMEWVSERFSKDVNNYVSQPSLPMNSPMKETSKFPFQSTTSNNQFSTKPDIANKPAVFRKQAGQDFPLSMTQINDKSNKLSDLDTLRNRSESNPFAFEGKNMKDIQLEGWEKQLNTLLKEGITVSSSTGQQGQPDTVTISATDSDAQELLSIVRQAGLGVFGGDEKPEAGYGAPVSDTEPEGYGVEPEIAPDVVGDGDDMLALIKKMSGIEVDAGGEEPAGTLSVDYEDEESFDDSDSDYAEEPDTDTEPETDEEGESDEPEDSDEDDQEKTDEGNKFTGNLAKAREEGKKEADLDGDGDMEPVKEGDGEMCHECGGAGGMHESSCGHRQPVEEEFQNDVSGTGDTDDELAKLKALLSMGNDLHKMKRSQSVGNPTQVAVSETITDWKKLSGIK